MSIQITYIGHSTTHIQSDGLSVFTDPVFSQRILCLKRHTPLSTLPSDFPEPKALLITHAHYDHLDLHSFKYFSSRIPVIVPEGLGRLISRFVNNPVVELDHHASHKVADGLEVMAFPVDHTGFRLSGLTYRNCNGYLITIHGSKIFYPGDTGFRDDFADYRGVDAALLPLGPCKPEWVMKSHHLTPEEWILVSDLLQAKVAIPVHWGTFRLSPEPLMENIDELKSLVSLKGLQNRIKILEAGQSISV